MHPNPIKIEVKSTKLTLFFAVYALFFAEIASSMWPSSASQPETGRHRAQRPGPLFLSSSPTTPMPADDILDDNLFDTMLSPSPAHQTRSTQTTGFEKKVQTLTETLLALSDETSIVCTHLRSPETLIDGNFRQKRLAFLSNLIAEHHLSQILSAQPSAARKRYVLNLESSLVNRAPYPEGAFLPEGHMIRSFKLRPGVDTAAASAASSDTLTKFIENINEKLEALYESTEQDRPDASCLLKSLSVSTFLQVPQLKPMILYLLEETKNSLDSTDIDEYDYGLALFNQLHLAETAPKKEGAVLYIIQAFIEVRGKKNPEKCPFLFAESFLLNLLSTTELEATAFHPKLSLSPNREGEQALPLFVKAYRLVQKSLNLPLLPAPVTVKEDDLPKIFYHEIIRSIFERFTFENMFSYLLMHEEKAAEKDLQFLCMPFYQSIISTSVTQQLHPQHGKKSLKDLLLGHKLLQEMPRLFENLDTNLLIPVNVSKTSSELLGRSPLPSSSASSRHPRRNSSSETPQKTQDLPLDSSGAIGFFLRLKLKIGNTGHTPDQLNAIEDQLAAIHQAYQKDKKIDSLPALQTFSSDIQTKIKALLKAMSAS